MSAEKRKAKKERYRIQAVRDLTSGIPREGELKESLKFALRSMMGALTVASGAIVTYNDRDVEHFITRGLKVEARDLYISDNLRTYFKKKDASFSLLNPRISKTVRDYFSSIANGGKKIEILSPIKSGNHFLGLIMMGSKINRELPGRRDLELMNVMTRYLASEMYSRKVIFEMADLNLTLSKKVKENVELISSLRSVYFQTIMALAAAIDAKDPYTRGHSERVAKISREIARKMGLEEDSVNSIYMASILHDIGKIATEERILAKRSKLTRDEKERVKIHPKVSFKILSKVKFPDPNIALYALFHHEWINGMGYPYGRKGDEIPLGARIIALADAFDAMVADRPYRGGKNLRESLREIIEFCGTQFDPQVVYAFLEVLVDEIDQSAPQAVITPIIKGEHTDSRDRDYIRKCLGKVRRRSRSRAS